MVHAFSESCVVIRAGTCTWCFLLYTNLMSVWCLALFRGLLFKIFFKVLIAKLLSSTGELAHYVFIYKHAILMTYLTNTALSGFSGAGKPISNVLWPQAAASEGSHWARGTVFSMCCLHAKIAFMAENSALLPCPVVLLEFCTCWSVH